MTKRIALAAALLAAPVLAHAEQPNLYWGVSLGNYTIDQRDAGGSSEDTTDFGGRLGYHFGDFIGIEARAGVDTGGFSGDNDTDTEYVGLFGRFDLPFEKTNVYLLLGASEVRVDGEEVDSDEYDSVAGGIGIELYGNERSALTLEYMTYSDDAYSGLSLGYKRHFNVPSFR